MKFKESVLAHKYLDGLKGIEIGASAHNPFGLNTKNVDYTQKVDVFKEYQIKLCGEYSNVDIVSNGDDLPFKDGAYDFVISSHAIEHFFDPIKTINEWLRVASQYVFMIIPHKERTFDKDRKLTTPEELKLRHQKVYTQDDLNNPENKYFNGVSGPYGHWNVWDTQSFLDLCNQENWHVVDVQDTDDKVGNGFVVVLSKSNIVKSLNSPLNQPYYIFAPGYTETSSGVRALHLLCHALNLSGEEAYITSDIFDLSKNNKIALYSEKNRHHKIVINTALRTPVLSSSIIYNHIETNRIPIVIYPETVSGNPLKAEIVVRFILNKPGFLGGTNYYNEKELLFTYKNEFLPNDIDAKLLHIPTANLSIFNLSTNCNERKGRYFFANRYLKYGGNLFESTKDAIELSFRNTRTLKELAKIFKSAELLYSYEGSAICREAMLCGCPVVYLPNAMLTAIPGYEIYGDNGAAWGDSIEQIEHAKNTVKNIYSKYVSLEKYFWNQLHRFVLETQKGSNSYVKKGSIDLTSEKSPKIEKFNTIKKLKIGLLLTEHTSLPCPSIRLINILDALQDKVEYHFISKLNDNNTLNFNEAILVWSDLIISQRTAPAILPNNYLNKVLTCGKPIIYELDDFLIGDLPTKNKLSHAMKVHTPLIIDFIKASEGATVSTVQLGKELSIYNQNIEVLPNLINDKIWNEKRPKTCEDKVIIVYAGSDTHLEDLEMIEDVLLQIHDKFSEIVSFVFLGCITPNILNIPNIKFVKEIDYKSYRDIFQRLDADIAIAPLSENAFNNSKSNIKWLEYSRTGIAGVYSDVLPYSNIEHKKTGMLAQNNSQSWFDSIEFLIQNPELRAQIALNAQREVREKYTISACKDKYFTAWSKFLDIDKSLISQKRKIYFQQIKNRNYLTHYNQYTLTQIQIAARYEKSHDQVSQSVIHFITTSGAHESDLLADTIDSISAQLNQHWRLTVFADYDAPNALFDEMDILQWIRLDPLDLQLSRVYDYLRADWVCIIPAGYQLEPHFITQCHRYLNLHPDWKILYFDEDYVGPKGDFLHSPKFRPDFNLDLLRSIPYTGHCFLINRHALEAGGSQAFFHVASYDLMLRMHDVYGEKVIGHVPGVLLHVPEAQGDEVDQSTYIRMLKEHYARHSLAAVIKGGWSRQSFRTDYSLSAKPFVSLIMDGESGGALKEQLESIIKNTDYDNYEIGVLNVDHPSPLHDEIQSIGSSRIKFLGQCQFSRAARINYAVNRSAGEYILILGGGIKAIHQDWLSIMLGYGLRPDVGIVSARQVYQGQVLHDHGVILGMGSQGIAEGIGTGLPMLDPGYMERAQCTQNFSAVSADCLLVRRKVFEEAGGVDEVDFSMLYGIVDFCLKVTRLDYKVVWTPYATLLKSGSTALTEQLNAQHHQSDNGRERDAMLQKWLPLLAQDPSFNRHLSLKHMDPQVEAQTQVSWNVDFHDLPRVYAFPCNASGVGEYRVRSPLRALTEGGLIQSSLLPNHDQAIIPDVVEVERAKPDVLMLQNAFADYFIEAWARYKKFNDAFMVYGQDDILYSLPSGHPKQGQWPKDLRRRIKKMMQLSDRVIVANEVLAKEFSSFTDNLVVVPNYLEKARWLGLQQPQRPRSGKPRVGWAGGVEHLGDLELIFPLVEALENEVDWVFMGMCPDPIRKYVKEFYPGVPFESYPQRLANLGLDLAIAPLARNKFNEAKTNLRLLEYGILGWPVVCSDITPYQHAPVTRLANNIQEWIRTVRDKVHAPEQLKAEGLVLQQWVMRHYLLEEHLDEWHRALLP